MAAGSGIHRAGGQCERADGNHIFDEPGSETPRLMGRGTPGYSNYGNHLGIRDDGTLTMVGPLGQFDPAHEGSPALAYAVLRPGATRAEVVATVDRNEGEAPLVNIGTGEDLSIRELAHCIAGVVGFQGRIGFDASKPDGTMRKLMSNDKLKSLIQIKPRTLEQGLIQVYRDYASRVPEPSPQR